MATTSAQFSIHSVVRGHHVYKKIWTPYLGEILDLHPEVGNKYDIFAVVVIAQLAPYWRSNSWTRTDRVVRALLQVFKGWWQDCLRYARKHQYTVCLITQQIIFKYNDSLNINEPNLHSD